jgi:isoleucyl-tRNA synthetase
MLALDRWVIDRAAQIQKDIVGLYEQYAFHQVYQKIHHFCLVDLGGFYLDIIKDRQYTTQADSLARRSCQTALWHVAEALVRWMAPILSFTAEEMWQFMPGDRGESVFLEQWYSDLTELPENAQLGRDFWQQVMAVKQAVNKAIEDARNEKIVKANLAADAVLFVSEQQQALLAHLGEELRFVTITSTAQLKPLSDAPEELPGSAVDGLKVQITASPEKKCTRCWHHRADVGANTEHPEICGRCVENVDGDGEVRRYA